MKAILKKELKSYFTSPIGYVILVLLTFFSGLFYKDIFSAGSADMSYVFNFMMIIIFFIIPIITMRLFSEEKHQKTDQLLLTAPVSNSSIVIGKFLSALIFFNVFVVLMILYNLLFYIFGATPDLTVFIGNLLGTEFLAAALIAIGIFISSLTESQVVAAVCSFSVSLTMILLPSLSGWANNTIVTKICDWISFTERYSDFVSGVFNIANFVFYISVIAVFLFLTVRVIDRKRWS
ncbi:MAG: ABC transporter permease [Acutalibacteraceae bacterium]